MINKRMLLNNLNDDEQVIISSLMDKIELAERSRRSIFSNEFYGPNIWNFVEKLGGRVHINIIQNGVFEEAERRMLCFTLEEAPEFPISIMKISNKSNFHTLKHKDYLGAVMSLGIKREKFGDFVVDGNVCYSAICNDIKDYISYNLNAIGKCPCSIEVLDELTEFNVEQNCEIEIVNASSMRIDCLAAALCNVSRSESENLIKQGKVFMDYSVVSQKDEVAVEGSVITIRGFGKFKVIENIGLTSKGRNKIKIKKYI